MFFFCYFRKKISHPRFCFRKPIFKGFVSWLFDLARDLVLLCYMENEDKCLKMLKFKSGHKCHNSQASKNWLSNSLPVSSRASLPGRRQCLHLCFSCKEYVFCFVLFCFSLVFCLTLWYRLLLQGAHEQHGCGCLCRQTSKAWPWTVFDFKSTKKTFLPIFVLRVYSGSAPQKQGQQLVTSGAGGSPGAPILHQLWGKRENIGANLCSEKLLQKSWLPEQPRWWPTLLQGVTASPLPSRCNSHPRPCSTRAAKGIFDGLLGSTIAGRIDGCMVIWNLCRLLCRSSW